MLKTFDVIVAGAGPAGCTLACELAKVSINVLVLEKYTLPRFKCCAGGITFKAAKNLPFDVNELAEDRISTVDVHHKHSHYEGKHDSELLYTISRPKLDYIMAKKAEEAGAVILQGQPLTRVERRDSHIEVSTPVNTFQSKFLVGADGARSIVARQAGFKNRMEYIAGVNAEIALDDKDMARWKGKVLVDTGLIQGGYAWVFPKSDHISVGVATIRAKNKDLNRYYNKFLSWLKIGNPKTIRKSGGLISICQGQPVLALGRLALVGDAAGLADPLSGEGVDNAIQSALLAAKAIKESLLKGNADIESYQQAVYEKIMPEIKIARVLQKLFIHFPQVAVRLLKTEPRVWRACCLFVRGEMNYTVAKQAVGGFKGVTKMVTQAMKR